MKEIVIDGIHYMDKQAAILTDLKIVLDALRESVGGHVNDLRESLWLAEQKVRDLEDMQKGGAVDREKQASYAAALQLDVAELQKTLTFQRERLGAADSALMERSAEFKKHEAELIAHGKTIEQLVGEKSSLFDDLQELREQAKRLLRDAAKQDDICRQLREERDVWRQAAEAREAANAALQEMLAQARTTIDNFGRALEEARAANEQLGEAAAAEVEEKKRLVEIYSGEAGSLRELVEGAHVTHKRLEAEREATQLRCQELLVENASLRAQRDQSDCREAEMAALRNRALKEHELVVTEAGSLIRQRAEALKERDRAVEERDVALRRLSSGVPDRWASEEHVQRVERADQAIAKSERLGVLLARAHAAMNSAVEVMGGESVHDGGLLLEIRKELCG